MSAVADVRTTMTFDLDHCAVAVRSLDAGAAAYRRLGFNLTSRSLHFAARRAGAPSEPVGSGNHCAMFRSGYLEIIGITDSTRNSAVKDMVARYEGVHTVAIGCASADKALAGLERRSVPFEAVRLERDAAFGPHDEEARRAIFRNLYVDRDAFPEARLLFIEHVTPEVLWQPHLLEHPNGVIGIEQCWFAAPRPRETAEKFATLFGVAVEGWAHGFRLPFSRGALLVQSESYARASFATTWLPPVPAPIGLGFKVAALQATEAFLKRSDVRFHYVGNALVVPSGEACGAALRFFE